MMHINRVGRVDDGLVDSLKKSLGKEAQSVRKVEEKQLEEQRKELDQEAPESTLEQALSDDPSSRTNTEKDGDDSEQGLVERRLRDQKSKGKNSDLQGTTQARLEKASKDTYPHRNPEAWERTGDARPINNLKSEMGEASDEERLKRWEKAEDKAQDQEDERIVDKDIGEQRPDRDYLKAFNHKRRKNAKKYSDYADYIAYKAGDGKVWNGRFAKARQLDNKLAAIMSKGDLSKADREQIASLKSRKWEILRVAQVPAPAPQPQPENSKWPTPQRVAQDFQVDEDVAAKVIQMAQQAEHAGPDAAEEVLQKANTLLGGFGVEPLRQENAWNNYYQDAIALYVNTGDTYSPTLLYDTENETFLFTTWGDFVEGWEQEQEPEEDEWDEDVYDDDEDEEDDSEFYV